MARARFRERSDEARMIGAGQRHHGVTIRVGGHAAAMLVRRAARGNEMNFVEMKAALGGARDGQVADVDGIECAAEERDPAFAARLHGSAGLCGGATLNSPPEERPRAMRGSFVIIASGDGASSATLRRNLPAAALAGARRSSASAMARTSCGMPSPEADDMA